MNEGKKKGQAVKKKTQTDLCIKCKMERERERWRKMVGGMRGKKSEKGT